MRLIFAFLAATTIATAAPKPGDAGTPEFDKAAALVKQLGHRRFATREGAAKQILEMGGSAVPALLVGTKSEDEEVRARSTTLLPQAKAAEWKRRADAYLADKEGKLQHDLPMLASWEKLTGKPDAGTRKVYAEMIRTSGEFLEEAAGPKAWTVLATRCNVIRERLRGGNGQLKAEMGELAAVVFIDTLVTNPKSPGSRGRIPRPTAAPLLGNPVWPEALDAAATGPVLRKLLVNWVDSKGARDDIAAQQFALLVRRKPFPEAVPALIRMAKDKRADVLTVRVLAIDALGKVGNADVKTTLTNMIMDATAVYGEDNEHRLGDAALAALINMSGKQLTDYGINGGVEISFATDDDDEGINISIYGFRTTDLRQKAIQKWKDEIAKKK